MSVGPRSTPAQRSSTRSWPGASGPATSRRRCTRTSTTSSTTRSARPRPSSTTRPLYKYVVSGPDAARLLDRVITARRSKMRVDQVYYTPWCDEEGKVVDDGTVTRIRAGRVPETAADPLLPMVPVERDRSRGRGRGRLDAACGSRPPGKAEPRGARGRHAPGLGRREVLPASSHRDRRRRGERDPHGLHRRPAGTSCGSPADGALERLGRGLRRGRTLRALPRRDPRPRHRPRRGRSDPDRGRVHERAARDQPRADLLARSSSASGGWSTSTRPRTSSGRRALLAEQRPAARRGGWWGSSSIGPASRGCSRSTGWPRGLARSWTAPPVPVYKDDRQVGPRHVDRLGHHDQEDGRVRLPGQGTREDGLPCVCRVLRRGRAGQGRRHRRAAAVPGSPRKRT